ncbi:hypothetical protein [Granulicella arctica]|uniref:hypothetical protein n=1 Tax=Granulicella arctica TaxID=940613 RepID=UPI003D7C2242
MLALFSFPLVSPVLASMSDANASVPICCRKNGKHHCLRSTADRAGSAQAGPQFSAPVEKCPYCPRAVMPTHPDVMSPAALSSVFAALASHSACIAQTESKWRIARDRSRQKRGPPSFLS